MTERPSLGQDTAVNEPQFHLLPDGRRIAYRYASGTGPALVFLPGYMSDMAGSKATAVLEWAQAQGRACLLLDYSGCGESGGDFAEGTLSRWRDEVLALINAQCPGPVVLIGSSMGGWLRARRCLKPIPMALTPARLTPRSGAMVRCSGCWIATLR